MCRVWKAHRAAQRLCRREESGSRGNATTSLRTTIETRSSASLFFMQARILHVETRHAASQDRQGWGGIYNSLVPLLEARNLVKVFSGDAGIIGGSTRVTRAVDDVSLTIEAGETL